LRGLRVSMEEHIKQDEAIHNQIRGARWAIYALAAAVAFCVPLGYQILQALQLLMGGK